MRRGRRAIGLLALALCCGASSAALASRYQSNVEAGLGDLRPAVVLTRDLGAGEVVAEADLEEGMRPVEVPAGYLAPDALADPLQALGRRSVARLPAGGVLLGSQLRAPAGRSRSPDLPPGTRPVELAVSAAAPLGRGPGGRLVDLVAAHEPGFHRGPRVAAVARGVRLLDLRRGGRERGGWLATVALDRSQALAAIEAENFARELRLLAR